jgi:imidazolonepropionase-like amidohydrolase
VTSVNAQLLRRDDLGRVTVGASADLVVYAGNPLEDPSLLWEQTGERRTVVLRGKVVAD